MVLSLVHFSILRWPAAWKANGQVAGACACAHFRIAGSLRGIEISAVGVGSTVNIDGSQSTPLFNSSSCSRPCVGLTNPTGPAIHQNALTFRRARSFGMQSSARPQSMWQACRDVGEEGATKRDGESRSKPECHRHANAQKSVGLRSGVWGEGNQSAVRRCAAGVVRRSSIARYEGSWQLHQRAIGR